MYTLLPPFQFLANPSPIRQRTHQATVSSSRVSPCVCKAQNIEHLRAGAHPLSSLASPFGDWPELLQLSIESRDFKLGQAIHAFLLKSEQQEDTFKGNNLINLYAKFGEMEYARRMFDEMPIRNTITWTSLMKGYLDNGDCESVFHIARDMYQCEVKFSEHTCSVVLRACDSPGHYFQGEQIHGLIIKSGSEENVVVGSSLISMYARNWHLSYAEKVLNVMVDKDVRCLNIMILEYGRAGQVAKALRIFIHLLDLCLEPNDYTFTNIISACSEEVDTMIVKQLHGLAIKHGYCGKLSIGNALITVYGNYGMAEEAERMFHTITYKSVVSWTSLMSAFLKCGQPKKAVELSLRIFCSGILFDSIFLATVINSCSECKNFQLGNQIHGLAIKTGYLFDTKVGSSLIDLYVHSRNLPYAASLFNSLSSTDTALFNAYLVGLMQSNEGNERETMNLFRQLILSGVKPDPITYSQLLRLSASSTSLVTGKSLHACIVKTGFEADLTVDNSLITMYGKCGCIKEVYRVFNGIEGRDIITWNAIISACALHGLDREAFMLFEKMKEEGFAPDEITALAILQVCCYSGLWEDGMHLFGEMETKYGIKPTVEHYACMVDLLGRAGKFSESMDLIISSPFSTSTLLWRTLVSACKLHKNLKYGSLASERLLELAPKEAGSYILVSNFYAEGGLVNEAAEVRTMMNDLKVSKETGSSWIEIDDKIHQFIAGDRHHPESEEIYAKLNLLNDDISGFKLTELFPFFILDSV